MKLIGQVLAYSEDLPKGIFPEKAFDTLIAVRLHHILVPLVEVIRLYYGTGLSVEQNAKLDKRISELAHQNPEKASGEKRKSIFDKDMGENMEEVNKKQKRSSSRSRSPEIDVVNQLTAAFRTTFLGLGN